MFAPPPGGGDATQQGDATASGDTTPVKMIPGTDPLDCSRGDCLDRKATIAQRCGYGGTTVTAATVGEYTVVVASTDPTSMVYTSATFVFDRRGVLVGRTMFVNEWRRSSKEGLVPLDTGATAVDACTR